jgi:hypothetical protein
MKQSVEVMYESVRRAVEGVYADEIVGVRGRQKGIARLLGRSDKG